MFDQPQLQLQPPQPSLVTSSSPVPSDQQNHRPFDDLIPANPIPFDLPRNLTRASRVKVRCYNPRDGTTIIELLNVLLPGNNDVPLNEQNDDAPDNTPTIDNVGGVQYAYYPFKEPIRTIMGHLERCCVLERCNQYDNVFRFTDQKVAIKVNYMTKVAHYRGRHAEDPLKEIAAMQLIGTDCPNVLGCKEVLYDKQNIFVVMPYCDSGDLYGWIADSSTGPGLSEGHTRNWFRQIMTAVQYMHEQCGLCHKDLSPENIMIHKNNRCVLIDMGMSLRVPYELFDVERALYTVPVIEDLQTAIAVNAEPFSSTTNDGINRTQTHNVVRRRRCLIVPQGTCGKFPYMAPEIYRNKDPFDGEAVDIWSAGTILFCMLTGSSSYKRPHILDERFVKMTTGLEDLFNELDVSVSPDCLHLLTNILQVNPRDRLTVQEIMEHPWLKDCEEPVVDSDMEF